MDSRLKKTLIIKNDSDSFEIYYMKELAKHGYHVKSNNEMISCLEKKSLKRTYNFIKTILSGELKRKIKGYDLVIVFSSRAIIPLIYFCKEQKTKIVYWQWNIVDQQYARKIANVKKFCEIWTFDTNDSERYGWKLNRQFYCPKDGIAEINFNKVKKTALFLGADKGRYSQLLKIEKVLKNYNINTNFYLLPDTTSTTFDDTSTIQILEDNMDYEEYLNLVKCNDLLIEVVQKDQTGLTLRALEAAFYNKKLLTNNVEIRKELFYNSDNIFIINYDSWDRFEVFITSPIKPVPKDILHEYTVEKWIENFKL